MINLCHLNSTLTVTPIRLTVQLFDSAIFKSYNSRESVEEFKYKMAKLLKLLFFLMLPSLAAASDIGGNSGGVFIFIILIPITALVISFLFKLIRFLSESLSRSTLILCDLAILIFASVAINYLIEPNGYGQRLLVLVFIASIVSFSIVSVVDVTRNGFIFYKKIFPYVIGIVILAPILALIFIEIESSILYDSDCKINLTLHYNNYIRQSAKDRCTFQEESENPSPDACEIYTDIERKASCYSRRVEGQERESVIDTSLCPKTLTPDDCYFRVAKFNHNSVMCELIISDTLKSKCITLSNLDCDKITDAHEKQLCYSDLIGVLLKKGNFNISSHASLCPKSINPSSCDLMVKQFKYIEKTGKVSIAICNEDTSPPHCLTSAARFKNDKSVCGLIAAMDWKEFCYSSFRE